MLQKVQNVNIVTQSPNMLEVVRTTALVAGTDVPVLITGEVGTGRNLFAQKIHVESRYKDQLFVNVRCSTLMAESKGEPSLEYSLADLIRLSSDTLYSGTLYLDEITDLPLSLQADLLDFIETGALLLPSGAESPKLSCKVPDAPLKKNAVRIIASTRKNLSEEVKWERFSADLYYRLNVIPIELPSLNQREGDIKLLMDYFFRELVREHHIAPPSITKSAFKKIMQYSWPGNVRELQNFCERMLLLFGGKEILATHLPHEFRTNREVGTDSPFRLPLNGIKLESVEADLMQQALQQTGGNKSRAASLLGLTRDTFLYRLKKYSISA